MTMTTLLNRALDRLGEVFAGWRSRQQAYAELSQLDDRSLADIGITRSDIPFVLTQPKGSPAPAWAKANRHSHAH
jgi:uncharacterized protein YjiS (DUF1127 family)